MLRLGKTIRLVNNAQASNQKERIDLAQLNAIERQRAIAEWYAKGGQVFLDWAKIHYRMHNGQPLEWDEPFLEDVFLAMGNPWIEMLLFQKPAQIGYTETLIAFAAFAIAYLRSPIGLGFEAQKKLYQMSGKRIQKAFVYCEPIQKLVSESKKILKQEDINSKECITVGGVPLELFYAKAQESKDDEQAPSGVRSFTAFIVAVDEFGLCDHGILDVAAARMAKSDWPTKITRAGSTPALEGGIVDTEFRKAKYQFGWQVECPHCNYIQQLDAFGNFLRPVLVKEDGIEIERYVNQIGHPLLWFNHSTSEDEDEAKSTAYIGCQQCAEELPKSCLVAGEFVCTNTGITFKELNDSAIANQAPIKESVGFNIPKLASATFDPEERIRFMFTTKRPSDGIQQFLGKATSLGGGKIQLSRLKACQETTLPEKEPDLIVMGADQGRYANWALIAKWWFADDKDKEQRWQGGFKQIIWSGQISGFDGLEKLAQEYNVDLVGLDSEPEFNSAVDYGLKHLPQKKGSKNAKKGQVYLFDQMALKGEHFRRTIRKIESVKTGSPVRHDKEKIIPIYLLDRTYALDAARDRIHRCLQNFPAHIVYNPKDNANLFHHYLTSDRLPNEIWLEATNAPDHFHHCDSFIEGVVKASLYEPGMSSFGFGGLTEDEI